MNPQHPVFGTTGDFITSPEISQVFGEVTAHVLGRETKSNEPTDFQLARRNLVCVAMGSCWTTSGGAPRRVGSGKGHTHG